LSEAATITRRISLAQDVDLGHLLGRNDDHLRTLESQLDIQIVARGHDVVLKGAESQVRRGEKALVQLAELRRRHPGAVAPEVDRSQDPRAEAVRGRHARA